jgi:putative transposase
MRRGRPLTIAWQDEAATLYRRYQQETKPDLRPRWHALWLIRTGRSVRETARVLGVHERSVQHWLAWYRAGGVDEVAAHRKAGKGTPARLSGEQQAAVVAETATGRFRTAAEVVVWVQEVFGAVYTVSGMHQLLRRLRCTPKVPRPLAEKASLEEQAAWKKGGASPPCASAA